MGLLDLFKTRRLITDLKEELAEAKLELEKRQEAINKTNAYWKRVVSETKRKSNKNN